MQKLSVSLNDHIRVIITFLVLPVFFGMVSTTIDSLELAAHSSCPPDPFFPFIAGFFPLLCFAFFLCLFSFLSGWLFLWLDYKPSRRPARWSSIQSGMVGWCGIRNGFRVSASEEGLYLTGILLFRFAFPTVRIPWEQVQIHQRYTFLFDHLIVYRVNTNYGPVSIHLQQEMEDFLNSARNGRNQVISG